MAKFQSPLLGYNNNVRHRGRVFHIQTEDSGVNHPHIITHLFMDGGRILKSVKKSYSEHVGADGMSETVRVMMKEQHKAMFIALRDGQFDELVDGQKAHEKKETEKAAAAAAAAASAKALADASASASASANDTDVTSVEVEVEFEAAANQPEDVTIATAVAPQREALLAGGRESKEIAINDIAVVPVIDVTITESLAESKGGAPSTNPEPPRSDAAPQTIPENRRPGISNYPGASVEQDLPPEVAALLAEDAPPNFLGAAPVPHPEPVSVEEPAPQSTTDPSMTMERAAAVAAARALREREESEEENPNTTREPERRRKSASELTLDFDALERDSSSGVSPMFQTTDLPPPPKNLFAKERGTGAYRAIEADERPRHADPRTEREDRPRHADQRTEREDRVERTDRIPPSRPQHLPPSRPQPASQPGRAFPSASAQRGSGSIAGRPSRPSSEGRYAPARPAAIFGAAAKQTPSSIFSDELVSDKSLDEVILSYLAEDLDPPRRK